MRRVGVGMRGCSWDRSERLMVFSGGIAIPVIHEVIWFFFRIAQVTLFGQCPRNCI